MKNRFKHVLRRFGGDRRGSPALEFALIAPLFFAVTLGTFEIGRVLYEQNRMGAAASLAARAVTLNGAADTSAIRAAIEEKLDTYDPKKLDITLSDESMGGRTFKRIDITYEHDFLIKFDHRFSGLTLTLTRYTAAIN